MKFIKSLFLVLILALTLCFCACSALQKEKTVLNISSTEGVFTKEMLLDGATLIVRGTVKEKTNEMMTNPTGKRKVNGEIIANRQITEYSFEISEIYKGTYEDKLITVKTSNGYGLTPDLILYGEDDKNILATPLQRHDFEVGKECIMTLIYIDDGYEERNGYYTLAGHWGYYPLNEEGVFQNKRDISINPKTLPEEILSAKGASIFQNQATTP